MTQPCVAVCLDCSEALSTAPVPAAEPYAVQPFNSYVEMEHWWLIHSYKSGHQVRPVVGHPSPQEAYARAFGEGT
jgi:hypothetical protein